MLRKEEIPEELQACEAAFLASIDSVNHNPHPFMIGPRHIKYASDHCGGMLGAEACRAVPCAHPGCNAGYDKHTYDVAAFIKLKRNCISDEIQPWLKAIVDWVQSQGKRLDGFAFVDTGYRIKTF